MIYKDFNNDSSNKESEKYYCLCNKKYMNPSKDINESDEVIYKIDFNWSEY